MSPESAAVRPRPGGLSVRVKAFHAAQYAGLVPDRWYAARAADEAGWLWLDTGEREVKVSARHVDVRDVAA